MSEIVISNIYKSFGADDVLKGLTLEINKGYVYGVVGSNGSGKSTLLKIITGNLKDYSGDIFMKNGLKLGYLEQLPQTEGNVLVRDVLKQAFEDIYQLEEQMRGLEKELSDISKTDITQNEVQRNESILNKYANIQLKYDSLGGHSIKERIKKVTQGLQINEKMQNSIFQTLSGGEKTRVLLGKLLLSSNDVLLLDEPTNHLDIDSIEWLERFIGSFHGTVVIVSHDRYFLDRCTDYIAEIKSGKAKLYKGNYSFYMIERDKEAERAADLYERQQKEIKRLTDRARQLHDWANNEKTHKKAFAIEKRIERMDKLDKPVSGQKIKISSNSLKFEGRELIKAEKLDFSYENGNSIFESASLNIYKGENVGLLGPNGCGKTTFIKLLIGDGITPSGGKAMMGASVKYAYLPQNVLFENSNKSILEYTQNILEMKSGEARNLLAKYNFVGDDVFKEINVLSGGEKSRLRLCHLLQTKINLLILDEPTNHLDIESREVLENMLCEFEGALFFISHDRYFIRRFANRIADISNKKINKYECGYDEYREEKEAQRLKIEEESDSIKAKEAATRTEEEILHDEKRKAEKRANDPWRVNKRSEIERDITEKENRLTDIEHEMFKDGLGYEDILNLTAEKDRLETEIDELLALWEKYS